MHYTTFHYCLYYIALLLPLLHYYIFTFHYYINLPDITLVYLITLNYINLPWIALTLPCLKYIKFINYAIPYNYLAINCIKLLCITLVYLTLSYIKFHKFTVHHYLGRLAYTQHYLAIYYINLPCIITLVYLILPSIIFN